MEQLTDEQLIENIRQGEHEAYRYIIERHKNYVFTLIYREIGHRETAEDLAQDVFVKMYRALSSFRGDAQFKTWLYRLTLNCVIDYRRSQKRKPLESVIDTIRSWFADRTDEPEKRLMTKEDQHEVWEILAMLPYKYRIALELFHLRQCSYQEIAAILDIPPKTVETRLYRAKQKFKQKWLEVHPHETISQRSIQSDAHKSSV